MKNLKSSKNKTWMRLITFTVITALLCQNIVWAYPESHKSNSLQINSAFDEDRKYNKSVQAQINGYYKFKGGRGDDNRGAMKRIGKYTRHDKEIIDKARKKEPLWLDMVKKLKVETRRIKDINVTAKFIEDDKNLPKELSAYRFYENITDETGRQRTNLVIVTRKDYREEAIYHEAREKFWQEKLTSETDELLESEQEKIRHKTHILASAEQSLAFAKENSLTPFHENQIKTFSSIQLKALLAENDLCGRNLHHTLVKRNLGKPAYKKYLEYEKLLRLKALLELLERNTEINNLFPYTKTMLKKAMESLPEKEKERLCEKVSKIEKCGKAQYFKVKNMLFGWFNRIQMAEALGISMSEMNERARTGDIASYVTIGHSIRLFHPLSIVREYIEYRQYKNHIIADKNLKSGIESLTKTQFIELIKFVREETGKQIKINEQCNITDKTIDYIYGICGRWETICSLSKRLGISKIRCRKLVNKLKLKSFALQPLRGKKNTLVPPPSVKAIEKEIRSFLDDIQKWYRTACGIKLKISSVKEFLSTWVRLSNLAGIFPFIGARAFYKGSGINKYVVRKGPIVKPAHYIPPFEVERLKREVLGWIRNPHVFRMLKKYKLIPEGIKAKSLTYEDAADIILRIKTNWLTTNNFAEKREFSIDAVQRHIWSGNIDSVKLGMFKPDGIYFIPPLALNNFEKQDEHELERAREFLEKTCMVEVPSLRCVGKLLAQHCLTSGEIAERLGIRKIQQPSRFPNTIVLNFTGASSPVTYWKKKTAEDFIKEEKRKFRKLKKDISLYSDIFGITTPRKLIEFLDKKWKSTDEIGAKLGISYRAVMHAVYSGRLVAVTVNLTGYKKRVYIYPGDKKHALKNIACGPADEDSHAEYNEQLERQFDALKKIYNENVLNDVRVNKLSELYLLCGRDYVPDKGEDRFMNEDEVGLALLFGGYINEKQFKDIRVLREAIRKDEKLKLAELIMNRKERTKNARIDIFFVPPATETNLFWCVEKGENARYLAAHYNKDGKRIYSSLPLALSKPSLTIGITKHELEHILYGKHDKSIDKVINNIAKKDAISLFLAALGEIKMVKAKFAKKGFDFHNNISYFDGISHFALEFIKSYKKLRRILFQMVKLKCFENKDQYDKLRIPVEEGKKDLRALTGVLETKSFAAGAKKSGPSPAPRGKDKGFAALLTLVVICLSIGFAVVIIYTPDLLPPWNALLGLSGGIALCAVIIPQIKYGLSLWRKGPKYDLLESFAPSLREKPKKSIMFTEYAYKEITGKKIDNICRGIKLSNDAEKSKDEKERIRKLSSAKDKARRYMLYYHSGNDNIFAGIVTVKKIRYRVLYKVFSVKVEWVHRKGKRQLPEEFVMNELADRNPKGIVFRKDDINTEIMDRLLPDHAPAYKNESTMRLKEKIFSKAKADDEAECIFFVIDKQDFKETRRLFFGSFNFSSLWKWVGIRRWIHSFANGLFYALAFSSIFAFAEAKGVITTYTFFVEYVGLLLSIVIAPLAGRSIAKIIRRRADPARSRHEVGESENIYPSVIQNMRMGWKMINKFRFFGYLRISSSTLSILLIPAIGVFFGIVSPYAYLTLMFIRFISENVIYEYEHFYGIEVADAGIRFNKYAQKEGYSENFTNIASFSDMFRNLIYLCGLLIGYGLYTCGIPPEVLTTLAVLAAVAIPTSSFLVPYKGRDYKNYLNIKTEGFTENGDGSVILSDGVTMMTNPDNPLVIRPGPKTRNRRVYILPWVEQLGVTIKCKEGHKPNIKMKNPKRLFGRFKAKRGICVLKWPEDNLTIELVSREGPIIFGESIIIEDTPDHNGWFIKFYPKPKIRKEKHIALLRAKVIYAESEDAQKLLKANNADALLVSSGKYLVKKEVAHNDIALVRAIVHEDIEALLQIIAERDYHRYTGIKELISARNEVREKYKNLFHTKKEPYIPADLILNDIIAKAVELIYLLEEGILSENKLTPQEIDFVNSVKPVIISNRHSYFTREFWDTSLRSEKIRDALNEGMTFYQTANSDNEKYKNTHDNRSCGTICESGHEGSYEALDSQLERQFEELRGILTTRTKVRHPEKKLDARLQPREDLTEEKADRAMVEYAKIFETKITFEQLQEYRKKIQESLSVIASEQSERSNPSQIASSSTTPRNDIQAIFFSIPETGTELFWVDNDYAGGHFNRAGTRIHISLPVILKRGIQAGIDIAKHDLAHIQGKGHLDNEGLRIVKEIAKAEIFNIDKRENEKVSSSIRLKKDKRYELESIAINYIATCPINCSHCSLHPDFKKIKPMDADKLKIVAEKVNAASGIQDIEISGGEAFSLFERLVKLVGTLNKEKIYIITSGYWGRNIIQIKRKLRRLVTARRNKYLNLTISVDRNHPVPIEYIVNIIETVCEDRKLKNAIDISLNIEDPVVHIPKDNSFRNLLTKLKNKNLIGSDIDLECLENFGAAIPIVDDKGKVCKFIELRKGVLDFIGNAESSGVQINGAALEGHNMIMDSFSILPNGEVSIHPYLMGLLSIGNILDKDESIDKLKMKVLSHPLVYIMENENFGVDYLSAYAVKLNPSIKNRLDRQVTNPARARVLLEDPIMKYCLNLAALRAMIVYLDVVDNKEDFKDLISGSDEEFYERLVILYNYGIDKSQIEITRQEIETAV